MERKDQLEPETQLTEAKKEISILQEANEELEAELKKAKREAELLKIEVGISRKSYLSLEHEALGKVTPSPRPGVLITLWLSDTEKKDLTAFGERHRLPRFPGQIARHIVTQRIREENDRS